MEMTLCLRACSSSSLSPSWPGRGWTKKEVSPSLSQTLYRLTERVEKTVNFARAQPQSRPQHGSASVVWLTDVPNP